jgi:hypothetical protein
MTWNLFIDDERNPRDVTWGSPEFYWRFPWTIARTLNEVQELIAMYGFPDFVSFDHDLGKDEPTGKDIANWLINYDMDNDRGSIPADFRFFVHSKNPIGKQNIEGILNEYLAYR